MNFLVVVAIFVLLVGLLAALKAKSPTKDEGLPFTSRDTLFSPAERSFLGVLEQALDNKYRVFGKVRLGDLVKPAKGLSNSRRTTALNKVNQKHVDFVVCSATDLAVLGVLELDDQSHGREDRAGRDIFVDHALSGAGIPIARLSAKRGYQIQEVRDKLMETFKLTVASVTVATAHPAPTPINDNGPTPTPPNAQESPPPRPVSNGESGPTPVVVQPEAAETLPTCEKCGADMVRRQAKNGPHAGKFFWACSTFPKCRQVVAITGSTLADKAHQTLSA